MAVLDTRQNALATEKPVPVRHPGRWAAVVVVLVLAAMLGHGLTQNPNFQWAIVSHYLLASAVLVGVAHTAELTAIAMGIGIALGIILAVMRLSPNHIVAGASWFYVWFFRATPVLVQLIFWFNLASLYRHFSFGIPFGPEFVSVSGNVITPFVAALLGLGLNEGAYMAEIVRGGILSVDEGQVEAASSLGMSRLLTMRRVILPQAMRVIIPPTGNETIGMLKNTALVSVIGYSDLLYSVEEIYTRNFKTMPLLIAASIWYIVLTSILYVGQHFVEAHYGKGFGAAGPSRGSTLRHWLMRPHSDGTAGQVR